MKTFIKNDIGMAFYGMGYHIGGIKETIGLRGCSHLMEHLMCKPFDSLLPTLTKLGIDYNAYTSDSRVVFHFSGLEDELKSIAETLTEKIRYTDPFWTEEQFNTEKNTVLQEYGDTFNSHTSGTYSNLFRRHYNYCSPIGFKQDILDFSYADSAEFAKRFFIPDQTVLVASEDFMPDIALKQSSSVPEFSFFEASGLSEEAVPKEGKTIVGLINKGNYNTTTPEDISAVAFIIGCLTDGLDSPLYQEIREKRGLSYFSSGSIKLMGTTVVPVFFASTSNENAERLANVYTTFFSKDLFELISKERFDEMKANTLISKRKNDILPHAGTGPQLLNPYSGYDGIEELTYEDIGKYSLFNFNEFQPFFY